MESDTDSWDCLSALTHPSKDSSRYRSWKEGRSPTAGELRESDGRPRSEVSSGWHVVDTASVWSYDTLAVNLRDLDELAEVSHTRKVGFTDRGNTLNRNGTAASSNVQSQDIDFQRFLKSVKPEWTSSAVAVVQRKLARLGIHSLPELYLSLQVDTGKDSLNERLRTVGCRCFKVETLHVLRDHAHIWLHPPRNN
mmetsp:Transcript_11021/g.25203  ORF Transcript_11021/g.25203 Transcript_11021/m.25203 type:complete len:195 (+) Transcript_11021:214-798(+)